MDRYVFTESRKYVEIVMTIAVFAFVIYSARRRLTVGVLFGLFLLLLSCSAIREILFMEKELVITNVYGMKFHIRYEEIKSFGEGIGSHVLSIVALKRKFIPLYFFSRGQLRNQMPEILARLEMVTGKKV